MKACTMRRGNLLQEPGVKAYSLTYNLDFLAGNARPFEILPLPSFPAEVFHPWHILQPYQFFCFPAA